MTRSPRVRRLLRLGAWLGGVFAVYTAFGFLGAPPILKAQLVRRASEALHRPVTVAKVRVNPLVLSVTIAGFAVADPDGAPFVAWDSLYVRLAPLRLFARELGLAEIHLVRPSLRAGLLADGTLSFQDLLAPPAPATPPPDLPPGAKQNGGMGFSIGKLAIEEARVTFRDATRKPAFESVVGPFTIRLESFRTRGGGDSPYSFTGTTDAGETFRWTGTVGTQPVRSAGTLAFEKIALPRYGAYLREATPAEVRSGLLDLSTRYELEWGPARHLAHLTDGRMALTDLALAPPGAAEPPVKLPRLEVSGVEIDAVARRAQVAQVVLHGPALHVVREKDGALELARLAPAPGPAPAARPGQPAAPWSWSVGAFAIDGAAVTWEDRVPQNPVTLALTNLAVKVEELRPGADAAWPCALSFTWPGGGKVAVSGPVQPFASQATLDLVATELDLVPLEPYLQPDLTARLTSGRFGAKLRLGLDAAGAAPRWTLAGDLRLDGLAVAERGNADLLRWKALEVNGMDVGTTPPHAAVKQVRLVEPRLRVYVWEDGATSFARARGKPAAPAPAPRPAAVQPGPRPAPWKTSIGAVEVVNARATFLDRSVAPPAVVNLTRATARITQLSTDPRVRSAVDVRLEVEGASPIRVTGTVNPLQTGVYTDLAVASEGVDLTPLGPYTDKYLGYGLQKGKLDLDLHYKIEDRKLTATNLVRLNQFTLGDGTNSPDAIKAPIKLALALLKDGRGVIELDVPIEGSLDDPEFRLGKVIWRAVINLLVKVATSPFRLLGALVGGGEAELSFVEFTPGTADLALTAQERLTLLSRSLTQRPELGLEVEGTADEAQDGAALRKAALERALRHAKAAGMKPPPESEDDLVVAPEERTRLVKALHAAAFPPAAKEKPQGAAKSGDEKAADPAPEPTSAELEALLLPTMAVAPDALASLAADRTQRVRDALVAAGIDQVRLFLVKGGDRAAKEKGPRVYFEVK
jgi:uncharacterized protein involved in outer membrane biogenesis